MKVGRPAKAELAPVGKPRIESWLSREQKAEVRKLIKACGGAWGELQTDLVTGLAVARLNLKEALAVLSGAEFPYASREWTAAQKQKDVAIGQICSCSTKLGLSKTGSVGKTEKKPQAGRSAAEFLTLKPRERKA